MRTQMAVSSTDLSKLSIEVEEAARAARRDNPRFVEPAPGTLDRAKAKRHHIIFGRRGSGKTSLLVKAAADLTIDRRPIAFVDLESFKGHSYPDVLLSVLIKTLEEFREWLETVATTPASRTTFWQRLFGTTPTRPPFDKAKVHVLVERIDAQKKELADQLHSADAPDVQRTTEVIHGNRDEARAEAGVNLPVISTEVGVSTVSN